MINVKRSSFYGRKTCEIVAVSLGETGLTRVRFGTLFNSGGASMFGRRQCQRALARLAPDVRKWTTAGLAECTRMRSHAAASSRTESESCEWELRAINSSCHGGGGMALRRLFRFQSLLAGGVAALEAIIQAIAPHRIYAHAHAHAPAHDGKSPSDRSIEPGVGAVRVGDM